MGLHGTQQKMLKELSDRIAKPVSATPEYYGCVSRDRLGGA